ncbi:hypothetical protein L1987_16340 [Smallanthus sonchifolius]|uniref:Uncharacterized protein n=1 Tax=Smallanthus sonchifolius TaxID=185202 RepID=A0ACB9J8H0_9ASTR|nr:hypothetical protein L1987_16340 [Smallanthus sonchifolius]
MQQWFEYLIPNTPKSSSRQSNPNNNLRSRFRLESQATHKPQPWRCATSSSSPAALTDLSPPPSSPPDPLQPPSPASPTLPHPLHHTLTK